MSEAAAKRRVVVKIASDQKVTFPSRLMMSLEQRMKMVTNATRESKARSGHRRMGRSAGRRRFLNKPPIIHTGA